jgi:hypothetical protein
VPGSVHSPVALDPFWDRIARAEPALDG